MGIIKTAVRRWIIRGIAEVEALPAAGAVCMCLLLGTALAVLWLTSPEVSP